jgi:hypothetical protein
LVATTSSTTRHAATINVWITWYVPTTARDVSATDGWYAVAAASHHDNHHHHAKPIDDGRRPANDGRLSVATYDGWRLSIVAITDGRFQDWSCSQLFLANATHVASLVTHGRIAPYVILTSSR